MKANTSTALLACVALLASCGDNGQQSSKVDESLLVLSDEEISALIEAEDYAKVVEAVKAQDERDMADQQDFINAATAYIGLADGVAAEVALDRAQDRGVKKERTAFLYARAFLLQGKFSDAAQALEDVQLEGQDQFDALLLKGDIARQIKDTDWASEVYKEAVDLQPDNHQGYLGLALLALEAADFKAAEAHAARAAQLIEADPTISLVRGSAARHSGRREEAEGFLREAIDLHGANLGAYFELIGLYIDAGRLEDAREQLDVVYALAPTHPIPQYYTAMMHALNGELEEAESLLLKTGDFTRDFPMAGRVYGHVLFRMGKYSAAIPYLRRFIDLVPQDTITRLALAECLTKRNQPRIALVYLDPLIEGEQQNLQTMMQVSAAYASLGKLEEVQAWIARAESLIDTNDIDEKEAALKSLRKTLSVAMYANGGAEQAMALMREQILDDISDLDAAITLGNMQLEQNQLLDAEETASKVLALEPENVAANNMMGAVRLRQRKPEEAVSFYSKALSLQPEYQSALKNRAQAYVLLGAFDKAHDDLEKLQELGASDPHLVAMRGRVYLELGDTKNALVQLRQAEDLLPNSAIIMTDLSEALVLEGYRSSGIGKAIDARRLASADPKLTEYLTGLINRWEEEEAAAVAAAEAEKAKQIEKIKKQEEAEQAAKEKLLKEATGSGDDQPDQS